MVEIKDHFSRARQLYTDWSEEEMYSLVNYTIISRWILLLSYCFGPFVLWDNEEREGKGLPSLLTIHPYSSLFHSHWNEFLSLESRWIDTLSSIQGTRSPITAPYTNVYIKKGKCDKLRKWGKSTVEWEYCKTIDWSLADKQIEGLALIESDETSLKRRLRTIVVKENPFSG